MSESGQDNLEDIVMLGFGINYIGLATVIGITTGQFTQTGTTLIGVTLGIIGIGLIGAVYVTDLLSWWQPDPITGGDD